MVRFGPAGNCQSFYDEGYKSSLDAPKWLAEKGLSLYEYSFGSGFQIKEETAKELGDRAKANNIEMSVHAPYYINLATNIEENFEKNLNYILTSLKYTKIFNGTYCVFHPGSCVKQSRNEALNNTKKNLDRILKEIYKAGYSNFILSPETMGKTQQIGTVDEIIELCKMDKCLIPTLDFGHINALTQGGLKTEDDYRQIFDKCLKELGEYKTKNLHIHFSKIEYSSKGEVKHLTLDDTLYGPEFAPLIKVIIEYGLTPTIICESKGIMALDAIKMQKKYEELKEIN